MTPVSVDLAAMITVVATASDQEHREKDGPSQQALPEAGVQVFMVQTEDALGLCLQEIKLILNWG